MTDKTETNTNENSVAPASLVGRLVRWYIGNEKRKLKCEIAREIEKCFTHEDERAWDKHQFYLNDIRAKTDDGCVVFYKATTVIKTYERITALIKKLDS